MAENQTREVKRLEQIIRSAKTTGRYCKQQYIQSFENVCVYGLGKFFDDTFEDRNLKELFHVNYLSDADEGKQGKEFYGITCVKPEALKNIENLVVILLLGNTLEMETVLRGWGIPYVCGYELFLEMSLGDSPDLKGFETNRILETYLTLDDEVSRDVYTEILANRLAPELAHKTYQELFTPSQYFNGEVFKVEADEAFVDCGAYDGDTIRELLSAVGGFSAVYAFEIGDANYHALEKYVETLDRDQQRGVHLYHEGVWSEKKALSYGNEEKTTAQAFSILKSDNTHEVMVERLDDVLSGERITFIKMDVEGSELEALKGAENIIKSQHPKLAICLYHKIEDFWQIPMYIKAIVPEYRFGIRHHCPANFNETVLYAEFFEQNEA